MKDTSLSSTTHLLTLNFKVVLEIRKKLNLRSKKEAPARKKKELFLYTESQMNVSNEDEHLLITCYIQDLAMTLLHIYVLYVKT